MGGIMVVGGGRGGPAAPPPAFMTHGIKSALSPPSPPPTTMIPPILPLLTHGPTILANISLCYTRVCFTSDKSRSNSASVSPSPPSPNFRIKSACGFDTGRKSNPFRRSSSTSRDEFPAETASQRVEYNWWTGSDTRSQASLLFSG